MIRAIHRIKAFGVFADFRWSDRLPAFKKLNLIYGWNYSGKTTLSRAIRCFELKQPHEDFPNAEVQLEAEDGMVHYLSAPETAPVFRVFNTDFVRDNLSFDAGSATPVLVLGAEDIAKQGILTAKNEQRSTIASTKTAKEKERDGEKSAIKRALTSCARDGIKNPLSVPNYDKTRFERRVIEVANASDNNLLDEECLAQCLTVFRSKDKKPALSPKEMSLPSVAEANERAKGLLARVVTASSPIARLRDDPAVESWVKEGRSLHDGKDTCQFCGQRLPADLMSHLTGHFSADYDNLMADLGALADAILASAEDTISLDHKANFYPELSERYAAEQGHLDTLLDARKSALDALDRAVDAKKTKAFTALECPSPDDAAVAIVSAVEAINRTIAEHNTRTAEFDARRQEAFVRLEKHYAASFARDHRYSETLREIAELDSTIAAQGKKIGELDGEIRALEEAISDASRGAERINGLLLAYFGKNELRIEVTADRHFQIVREGIVAKNLSEGEKTAIAFAHFITRVQDGRHPLADTIVVIDDPISSLDANHLFNTFALIRTHLSDCHQLFIATHSFEFYNLILEWFLEDENKKKPQAEWRKSAVFLVKRTDSGSAVLEEAPKELLRFKSEYHYLFSTLYHFDQTGSGDFDCLLTLPNVTRRFMEAFGGIMIPLSIGLNGKMPRLFPDEVERLRVWKFINYYSHNTTLARSLVIPDLGECKAVVQACLRTVRERDRDHFADLEREVR